MTLSFLHSLTLLESSKVPYVIIGGCAVVIHGVSRFTPDLNIHIDWEHENISELVNIFHNDPVLKFEPEFVSRIIEAKEGGNSDWLLPLPSLACAPFRLELMLQSPIPFKELATNSLLVEIADNHHSRVCSLEDLITMKKFANRGQDKIDVTNLLIAQALAANTEMPPHAVDPEYIETLKEFSLLSIKERFSWLENMLLEYRKLLGGV